MTVCRTKKYFVYFEACKLADAEKDPVLTGKAFQKAEQTNIRRNIEMARRAKKQEAPQVDIGAEIFAALE